MNVKKLISELKAMPCNLPVAVSMHDNSEHEVAGWVSIVSETTDEFDPTHKIKCVVLHC